MAEQPPKCECGKESLHHVLRPLQENADTWQCCKCHVEGGGDPSDWHKECMRVYRKINNPLVTILCCPECNNVTTHRDECQFGALEAERDALREELDVCKVELATEKERTPNIGWLRSSVAQSIIREQVTKIASIYPTAFNLWDEPLSRVAGNVGHKLADEMPSAKLPPKHTDLALDCTPKSAMFLERTSDLRWLHKRDYKILQQAWIDTDTGKVRWRDVPCEDPRG